jgi:hypothetical protein
MDIKITNSDKLDKKYKATYINPETGRENNVYFGDSNYEDYTQHHDDNRKEQYLNRHRRDSKLPGLLSRELLWNKKSLLQSIKDFNSKHSKHSIKVTYSTQS